MTRKQIAIFSGSFNPIHIGHIALANYIKEFSYIDELWLIVSPHNPLKNAGNLLSDKVRLEMAQLAIEGYNDIKVSDVEFDMSKPSYTINTLNKLSLDHPDKDFTLVIGGDNWNDIHKWKDYKSLLQKYKVIIYPRLGQNIHIGDEYKNSVQLLHAPIIEVSSTFIRQSIEQGKDMRGFLPVRVYQYIIKHSLYQ